ncbi:MAG: coproporphyrinogen III oxidase [Microbacteriaceae bacterium]|nr:coproporphyrinogen III oxidase [Microbacteriaceae bacterium]
MSKQPIGDPAPIDGSIPSESLRMFTTSERGFSAYVHVPFCTVRCGYCDFNTYTATELRGFSRTDWAGAIIKEIEFSNEVLFSTQNGFDADELSKSGTDVGNEWQHPLQSVFFGGGTPSLIPAADIAKVISTLARTFGLEPEAEVTLEANPDTVSAEYLQTLVTAGVNRISIGMQSAVPHVLATLDRTHNPENVRIAVDLAKATGLETSVDLIYGAPGESLGDWKQTVQEAIALETNHISAYALIVEEGTKLHRQIRRGEFQPPSDDLQAEMYEYLDAELTQAGFSWYEISNWAKTPKHRSKHNIAYWQGDDWWGYGPGAHSHIAGVRWWNVKHPAAWSERLSNNLSPALQREVLSEEQIYEEGLLLRSRLIDGLELADIKPEAHPAVSELVSEGLLTKEIISEKAQTGEKETTGERLVLTLTGRLLADTVILRLLT